MSSSFSSLGFRLLNCLCVLDTVLTILKSTVICSWLLVRAFLDNRDTGHQGTYWNVKYQDLVHEYKSELEPTYDSSALSCHLVIP